MIYGTDRKRRKAGPSWDRNKSGPAARPVATGALACRSPWKGDLRPQCGGCSGTAPRREGAPCRDTVHSGVGKRRRPCGWRTGGSDCRYLAAARRRTHAGETRRAAGARLVSRWACHLEMATVVTCLRPQAGYCRSLLAAATRSRLNIDRDPLRARKLAHLQDHFHIAGFG